jgi:hypothetical protein
VSSAGVRVGVGTRFRYDGETVEVIEIAITSTGNEVVLKDHHGRLMRLAVDVYPDLALQPAAGDIWSHPARLLLQGHLRAADQRRRGNLWRLEGQPFLAGG